MSLDKSMKKQWHLCFSLHVLVLAAGDPARKANRHTRPCSTRQRNVHGRVWTWIWHFGLRSVIPSARKCCLHWMVVAYVIGASARAATMCCCCVPSIRFVFSCCLVLCCRPPFTRMIEATWVRLNMKFWIP